jgi:hypothetical protein
VIDTTGYSYEEWIRFAFDHPVAKDSWYFSKELEFECDREKVIAYYTRLFLHPRPALAPYDDDRLEQGFWFILGTQLGDWIWYPRIPLSLRIDCVSAMPTIFREFLMDHPLEETCLMWWDLLRPVSDDEDPVIVEATLQALEEILKLPARHCQQSALHGLGHLNHPKRGEVIREFLRKNVDLDHLLASYAKDAIAGKVL